MAFKEPPSTTTDFLENGYTGTRPKDFPILPADGSWYQFHRGGWARRLPDGSEEIVTKFGSATTGERQGFETILRGFGEPGYEIAHGQGRITGVESPYGLGMVRREVNQEFQKLGVEKQIAEIQREKPDQVDLYLRTIVKNDGVHLENIEHQLEGIDRHQHRSVTLFTAGIAIDQSRSSGTMTVSQFNPEAHNLHSEHKQEFRHSFKLDAHDKNRAIGNPDAEAKMKNSPKLAEKRQTKNPPTFDKER